MSWVFLFSLPLGGFIATRYGIPKAVMFSGLAGTVIVGAAIPFTDVPFITFTLFGILYAASAPILGALPAQVLTPENRGPGLGIYYIWYFLGCALLPILGGYLRDLTGTAAASVLFAVGLMLATLILAAVFHAARSALQAGIAKT